MKSIFLFIANFVLVLAIYSQEKVFEYDLSKDFKLFDKSFLAPTIQYTGNSVYSHILLSSKTQIKHFYQSIEGKQREIIIRNKNNDPEDTLFDETKPEKNVYQLYFKSRSYAHISTPDELLDVVYYQKTSSYYFISTNTKTGELSITDTFKLKYPFELIDYIIDGTTISLIHYIQGENKIRVLQKEWHKKIKSEIILINLKDKAGITIPNFIEANDIYNKTFYAPETNLWIPPAALFRSALSFRNKYELSIILNDKDFSTTVIVVDLLNLSYKTKTYRAPKELLNKKGDNISVWLTDSTLIRGYGTSDSLYLFFNKKDDTVNYKPVFITKDNFSHIISGTITKSGNFWSKSNLKEVSFADFLKKCDAHKLLITGYEEKGNLFLTLATKYDLLVTSTLLGNIFTLGTLNFSQADMDPIYKFDVSTNLQTGTFNIGDVKKFVWEKIFMFIFANRNNFFNFGFRNINGYYYINTFNPETKKVTVYRFQKFL
jgi:hypothetical protein